MNRTVKWVLIIGVSLIAVFIAALVLLPKFVDVKQYKPRIEAQVTRATGRAFSLGDDLRLSLFPYASLSFSDLHLGSLPGFKEKDFVIVKSFDVRVKLVPLLFKDIQVKRFMDIDQIDLDRYLPSADQKEAGEKEAKTAEPKGVKKTDYSKLRRLSLNGTMRIGKLKIKNAKIERVHLTLTGEKGIFNLQPLTMGLYQGDVSGSGMFSVQHDVPRTNIQLKLNNVQAGPLLVDVLKKDFLEGMLKAQINLIMKGDDAVAIKRTLNGKGDLLFKDGAIKGIDLDGMAHNAKAAFGLAEKDGKAPRTDFSELRVPFSVKNGLVSTANTTLISPLIRLTVSGNADLIKELLDFRLEPKLVGTFKGQGDTKDRSGLMVPVLVAGSFSSPKFRPDLEEMLKQEIGKSLPDLQNKLLGTDSQKEESGSIEEQIKGILKGFGK